jgi:mono/diheme cytochrome c family protein
MRRILPIITVSGTAALAASASAQGGGVPLPALFTQEQARRGAESYAARCAACHGAAMEGIDDAPALTGPRFREKWLRQPLLELFTKIRVTMPQDEPGSLRPGQAADIVAATLAMSGLPSGDAALPADPAALRGIGVSRTK